MAPLSLHKELLSLSVNKGGLPVLFKFSVFSDECLVQMFPNRSRFVRRPIGTRFCNRCITQTVKFGEPSILVLGAIKRNGTRILNKCPIRLDSVKYQMVFEEDPCKIYDSESVFM